MGRRPLDLAGRKQLDGLLTALERLDHKKGSSWLWRCLCACGNESKVTAHDFSCGKIRSCGCLRALESRPMNLKRRTAALPRRRKIAALRKEGWTMVAIGKEFGISKQRVSQILKLCEEYL